MKTNKYIGVMLTAGLMLAAASCTDYSDYNSVPEVSGGNQPGANNTLWENISSDPQLTKFASLAQKCKFSEALNSPRFYTVWAPVDNAISDADYNRLMATDDAVIVKQFMQQHVTEYNNPISAALDSTTIVSLNSKHHPFTQRSFDGYPYVATNLAANNGVMHKINGMSAFHNNLYENIDDLQGCDSIKSYIQKYDEYYLDLNASVIGPLRDGKQTYLDSVMKKRNTVIRDIMRADLEDEDSTFCMLIPNNKAWNDAYTKINSLYKYISKMDYMDLSKKTVEVASLTATTAKADKAVEVDDNWNDSLTCRNIVSNLVFSKSYPSNHSFFDNSAFAPTDTVYSTSRKYLTDMQEVVNHTISTGEMSNGKTRIIDSLTFKSWQTYNPVIRVTYPAAMMKVKDNKLTQHNISLDSLKKQGRDSLFSKVPKMFHQWLFPSNVKSPFFSYIAVDSAYIDGTTSRPEFDFALQGVRSGKYHVYVVTVPAQVEDSLAKVRPYYLRFWLSWTDSNNKQQLEVLPKGSKKTIEISTDNGTSTATAVYLGDPGRVNVIDLGEVEFSACYYGTDAYPSLMMEHTKKYTSKANREKYDQQMRVAGVYLVPKEYNDYWANSSNE